MKPLRLGVVVKNARSADPDFRGMGYFAYEVDGLTWTFIAGDDLADPAALARRFDVLLHEDFVGDGYSAAYAHAPLPVVYLAIDSTLGDAYYRTRLPIAQRCQLILVDHDDLARWRGLGAPVRRWGYCVNDQVFHPAPSKTVDVALHMGKSERLPGYDIRSQVTAAVTQLCAAHGWTLRRGILGRDAYAASLAGARVAINWPRVPANRPHRVLDTLACGTALLSGPIPILPDLDSPQAGTQYVRVESVGEIEAALVELLDGGRWADVATAGYLWSATHTWTMAARELRAMLLETFPRLRARVDGVAA